ncbi:DUF6891 domain-containing protein [Kitasatospora sp. NPDC088346]|uniref:DUF6891 domain-containing protein n=1 Tax=Kitasatospora sp. NPDC088346 TaxID=3364073 RepID=UPI0038259B44
MTERADLPTPADLPTATREEAERFAREQIHGGFRTRALLVRDVEEHFDPAKEPVTREQAAALVDLLWEERLAEQAAWPATTDADRLLAAFDTLGAAGVTARADFTCCRNCGHSEIDAEAADGDHGFVFFHQQDTARVAAGGGLWLSYGPLRGSGADAVAVGREIAGVLTAAGLPVEWDGSADTRIRVALPQWHKRLPQG